MSPSLNLGVVAHVDAGKTTLTERLLFETGVIGAVGRVDHGDTVTDADVLERRRGITIRSAVVSFSVDDVTVNLIDTPGHSDFVAEVERALAILDGAVLVVSAVEGVQAQTRVLIRIMERLGIPFLVFVNKIDRTGAEFDRTVEALREAMSGAPLLISRPVEEGSRAASVEGTPEAEIRRLLTELVADCDDAVMRAYLGDDRLLDSVTSREVLVDLTAEGRLHPTYAGAALVGIGVPELLSGIAHHLPVSRGVRADPLQASVFKVERGKAGQRLAFARLRSGTVSPREHVAIHRQLPSGRIDETHARVTGVATVRNGASTTDGPAEAGDVAVLTGLGGVRIGDQLGAWDASAASHHFAPPGLESVVRAVDPAQRMALFEALRELSAQDPLIDARIDGLDRDVTVSLYGEVQKEVLTARLADEFGVVAAFSETRTVYVERVTGVGESTEAVPTKNAGVGLRVGPAEVDAGLVYSLAVERGWILPSHHTAIEETLAAEMSVGLFGWRVVDLSVALIVAFIGTPMPPSGYYRQLTSSTFRRALADAGTVVCEPWSAFEVDIPAEHLTVVLYRIIAARGEPEEPQVHARRGRLTGALPTAEVHGIEARLPDLTSGLGSMTIAPAGFRRVIGPPPRR